MATVSKESIAHGFNGTLGGLIFRQVNSKTIVSKKASGSRGNTPFQQFRRQQFREATEWAKKMTRTSREKRVLCTTCQRARFTQCLYRCDQRIPG